MADTSFPERASPGFLWPVPVERIVPREPLRAIHEALAISIQDVVNEARFKGHVAALWKVRRLIEREAWLRRQCERVAYDAWVDAHL